MGTQRAIGLLLSVLTACASDDAEVGDPPMNQPDAGFDGDAGTTPSVTYYRYIKPIVDARCVGCHQPGAIGPFDLSQPELVPPLAVALGNQVSNRFMPPWPPDNRCRSYRHDRSLTQDQVDLFQAWVDEGAALGDPATEGPPIEGDIGGLSRIDLRLQVPEPYTPQGRDDYHCFVIEWPETETSYVTGFGLEPGNSSVVHHVNMYLADARNADTYRQLDANDAGPGYSCFGGVFGNGVSLMGAWAPGSIGIEFPEGTGIQVDPGSVVVLEMHFNTGVGRQGADQSTALLKTATTVDRRAAIMPVTDLSWSSGNMPIPSGAEDTMHDVTYFGALAQQAVAFFAPWLAGQPLEIHAAGLHMHYLGKSAKMDLLRGGNTDCVIDIPDWDFDWQSGYLLREPMPYDPAVDGLRLECRWNNSAANQPVIDGVQRDPSNVNWGSNSDDEMCIGYLYLTSR